MAVRMFAAVDVGSFELEMGIYEISGKNRIRAGGSRPSCDLPGKRYI